MSHYKRHNSPYYSTDEALGKGEIMNIELFFNSSATKYIFDRNSNILKKGFILFTYLFFVRNIEN